MLCVVCQVETKNPKFCSRSCAAKFNNKSVPKRKPQGKCKICEKSITSGRTYCKTCSFNRDDITIADMEDRYSLHHKSSAYALVRSRARRVANNLGWTACEVCGYNKHIEIAHIKPISSYPKETPISEINNPSNLRPLCPNCHWEFDNQVVLQGIEP